ncbi:MAG TPA: hypothetical protein PLP30_04420 [Clostridia bacterium]|nr:hypothetical protein [Clostridia bacterium]HPQ46591.1 hypothetical protein [Clostridia bacterium]HRX41642.1 hypothetical protein [Clostridia bacterium]
MNINDLNYQIKRSNEGQPGPCYIEDIDTPVFDYLHKQIVTKNFVLEPLGYKHFLDLFEFRLQNEPDDKDPFENLGERFDEAYTQFFTYMCNIDNLAWVMIDRIYVAGFYLLEMEVDYNNYLDRNAHLYYETCRHLDKKEIHMEMIKAITDNLFSESDIPRLDLHLEEADDDKESMRALEELGFKRHSGKEPDGNIRYTIVNDDPRLSNPPRHMPFILKAYQDRHIKQENQ